MQTRQQKSTIAEFCDDIRGNTAMIFALSAVVIVMIFGLVFDFSRAQNIRTSLQSAVDAAALAIARDPDITPASLQLRATDFFNANMQGQSFGVDLTIIANEINQGAGIEVNASAKLNMIFASLFGMDSFVISTRAEVVYSTTKVELVLALDNTGSMLNNGKITALREASRDLVDQLLPEGASEENVAIGIVPFNYMVRLPTSFRTENWMLFDHVSPNNWNGCVGPRRPSHDTRDSSPNSNVRRFQALPGQQCPNQALTPLTNDRDVLHDSIDEMEANNWTYIPEGLAWAWRVLSRRAPIRDGVRYNNEDWTKILVLMTDGANTVTWNWPHGHPQATLNTSSRRGNIATSRLCNRIKLTGIIVYTIAFDVNNAATVQMMENCASEPGMFFDAENNADLSVAFAKISSDITNLRISQ